MHLVVIFENIGGYHAARLRGAHCACIARGGDWRLSAIQITNAQNEHPWGELSNDATPFPIFTAVQRENSREALTHAEISASGARVAAILKKLRPDVVAIPGWGFPYSRAALNWCKKNRAASVLMSESKWNDEPRAAWKEFLKSQLYVRHFGAAIVGAESHRDYLVKLGMKRAKIFTGYDAVDNDYFHQKADEARANPALARARQPAIPTRKFFLAVTRFIPRKNLRCLVEAFALYRKNFAQTGAEKSSEINAPWDLVICGSGAGESDLRAQISEQKLDGSVHLPGFVGYREIGDWYGLAGAFIHPALHEQWGLVANEAMAAGLPVIVSNRCGCFADLVQSAGFGFDPTNARELAEIMQKVSASSEAERATLGEAAREQVRKFSPEHFGAGMLNAADAALARV